MSRNLTPDQEDENILKGKISHDEHYSRNRKEVAIGGVRLDMITLTNGKTVVSEIKKSSSYLEAATLQLRYYLYVLQNLGIEAAGEIRVPDERKVIHVGLEQKDKEEIQEISEKINAIVSASSPPEAKKIRFCGKCAYSEFCWA